MSCSIIIIIFQPFAVESLGPINASGRVFLSKLGRKLADQSDDDREISFFISATLRFHSAVQCHLTALLFCEGGGGVRFILA